MDRPVKTIKLPKSGITVLIAEYLTFGESTELENIFLKKAKGSIQADGKTLPTFDGSTVIEWNKRKLEIFVKGFVDKEGKDIAFSPDFLDSLPSEDGQLILAECDQILADAKKK